jgi:hypothetical protein
MISKVWSWIEKNRFTVLIPLIGWVVWIVAVGCTPTTQSPFDPDKNVTAMELQQDYLIWQKENEIVMTKFENAGQDLQRQADEQAKFFEVITTLASGNVADLPGLIQLLLGSGVVGLFADNIRKNGVIGGLKRNA